MIVHNFKSIMLQFLDDAMAVVKIKDILDHLVLNCDHTAVYVIPVHHGHGQKEDKKKKNW